MEEYFTPLRFLINEVFNAIKDQPWIRHPRPLQHNPTLPEEEECCSYHDSNGRYTMHCRSLQKYLKELVRQGFLKEYILTLGAASDAGQSSALTPAQPQHMIT